MLTHGRGQDQELAGKNPKRRHPQNRHHAEHQTPAHVRVDLDRPRISLITWVPAFCVAWPTVKKTADLISECTVMCNKPAKLAIGPPMPKAKVISPICSIDE